MHTPIRTRRDGVILVCPHCVPQSARNEIPDYISQPCEHCTAERLRLRRLKRRAMLIVNNAVTTY